MFFFITLALGTIVFIVVLVGINWGWFSKPSLLTEIIVINVIVTFLLYRLLFNIQSPQLFVNAYLISIVAKLLFYTGLLLAVRFSMPETLTPNAMLMLVCYFVFTAWEVAVLFLKVSR